MFQPHPTPLLLIIITISNLPPPIIPTLPINPSNFQNLKCIRLQSNHHTGWKFTFQNERTTRNSSVSMKGYLQICTPTLLQKFLSMISYVVCQYIFRVKRKEHCHFQYTKDNTDRLKKVFIDHKTNFKQRDSVCYRLTKKAWSKGRQ